MKRIIVSLLCLLLLLPGAALGEEHFEIVTSFYPMYVFTLNVVDGIEGVTVTNMTDVQTGCLHDYQLLPADMRTLAEADAFVVNGAGMEMFLEKVIAQYGTMPVIDAAEGIALLYGEHLHGAEENDHGHEGEAPNGHVWLDPRNAAAQVRNIGAGLAQADPAHAEAYLANAEGYAARLEALYGELETALAPISDRRLVTFHDAFPYFAQAFDFEIVASMHIEAESQPSTRDVAELVTLVREEHIRALFAEPQYDPGTAELIARETDVGIYVLDPIVTGEMEAGAYEAGMRLNAQALLEALGE